MQQSYSNLCFTNQQDKAKQNLLKCSENLHDYTRQFWDLKLELRKNQVKRKKPITQILKPKTQPIQPYANLIRGDYEDSKKENLCLKIKREKLAKFQRRYATEKDQPIEQSSKKETLYPYIQAAKSIETELMVSPESKASLNQKARCKTVFIHMLKNKTTDVNLRGPSQYECKTIHSLSSIKVRILTQKIAESKLMKVAYKDLKQKIASITMPQTLRKRQDKSDSKRNKVYLNEIVSKQRRRMAIKENLKFVE